MTTAALHPPLLDSHAIPLAELLSMWLDGDVYRVGERFSPLDLPETAEIRAAAFAADALHEVVADRASASWIHGARPTSPRRWQVCVLPGRRGGRLPPWYDSRQRNLAADDVTQVAGIAVTTPLRTAFDLLVDADRFGRSESWEVRWLLHLDDATPFTLRRLLGRSRVPGIERARARLDQVELARLPGGSDLSERQPPLTRYTS
ncbi:type IV toxin-antitoxin system AbiEi family antitoxin [Leifsonia sp. AG29]|uniref:type IV toxin-antitoxin system AbiEi family antitoxin n=1 Tax=Leifsonia sp. AG29 TaxID=2598860 RepID=UPI00131E2A80|nr:hypothetical protein [Leifsonia sp. AG29]